MRSRAASGPYSSFQRTVGSAWGRGPRRPDVGPLWHPLDSYVLAMSLRNLKQVYVGGRLVSEGGVSTNPLAAEATSKVHEQLPALAAEHGWPP